ncbi:hypothetical protein ACK3OH_004529 [Salmonella enterica]
MTEAEKKEKYIEDVELVQNLIKNYRDNNPPAIKAGSYKETNIVLIYVFLILAAFSLGCAFVSEMLGAIVFGLFIAIVIYCFLCGYIVTHEERLNEWKNDFVSHDDFEKMSLCDTELKEMVNRYVKETKKDLTYSALDCLIERYKYEMKEKRKKLPFDIAS